MYAAIHFVVGSIDRNRLHAVLQNGGRFGENGHQIAAAQKVEDDVYIIHLYHNLVIQIFALYHVIKGVACLQTLARKDEVVTLQIGKLDR